MQHFGHQLSKPLLMLMLEIEAHGVSLVVDAVDFRIHVVRNALEVVLKRENGSVFRETLARLARQSEEMKWNENEWKP